MATSVGGEGSEEFRVLGVCVQVSLNPSLRYPLIQSFQDPISYQDLSFGVGDMPKLRIPPSLEFCYFLKLSFCFGIILDLQKSCRDRTEISSACTPYLVSANVHFLLYCGTFVKTKTSTSMHY